MLPATLPVTRIFPHYPTRTLPEVKKKTLPVTACLAPIYKRPYKILGQLSSVKFFTVDPYCGVTYLTGLENLQTFSTYWQL